MSRGPAPVFVAAYDYTDIYYRLVFQKVRYRTSDLRGKTFRVRRRDFTCPGGWSYRKPDHFPRYLYRLPDVFWAVQHGHDVWWAEGEKDAESLRGAGVVATTHGGAGNANAEQAEWFRGHEGRVLLVMDRDAPGALDVVQRYDLLRGVGLAADQLIILRPRGVKDASDHLSSGYTVQDFRPVHRVDAAQVAAQATPAVLRRAGYRSAR